MKNSALLAMLAICTMALTGCSTTGGIPRGACITASALVAGAAAGYGTEDEKRDIAYGLLGGVVGALGGAIFCPGEPEPVAAAEPTPAAPAPAPAPAACLDSDGDGVCDSMDYCAGTPSGTKVDARGCPEIPGLTGVNFEFNSSKLNSSATSILNEGAGIIRSNPDVRVEITGHTDSVGSDAYNQKLSERRADSVKTYLEGQGIEATRLSASGRGESEPIDTNDTKEGRANNRRVELKAEPR